MGETRQRCDFRFKLWDYSFSKVTEKAGPQGGELDTSPESKQDYIVFTRSLSHQVPLKGALESPKANPGHVHNKPLFILACFPLSIRFHDLLSPELSSLLPFPESSSLDVVPMSL